jgi:hypothetical protein
MFISPHTNVHITHAQANTSQLFAVVNDLMNKLISEFVESWWTYISQENDDFVRDIRKLFKVILISVGQAGETRASKLLQRIMKVVKGQMRNFRRARTVVQCNSLNSQSSSKQRKVINAFLFIYFF